MYTDLTRERSFSGLKLLKNNQIELTLLNVENEIVKTNRLREHHCRLFILKSKILTIIK